MPPLPPTQYQFLRAVVLFLALSFAGCGSKDAQAVSAELRAGEAGARVVNAKCGACHAIEGVRGPLAPSLSESLASAEAEVAAFDTRVASLRADRPEDYAKNASSIEAVLAATGREARLGAWLRAYLRTPKFLDPGNTMAPVSMTDAELAEVIAYLTDARR